jgi:hypothetical protein
MLRRRHLPTTPRRASKTLISGMDIPCITRAEAIRHPNPLGT